MKKKWKNINRETVKKDVVKYLIIAVGGVIIILLFYHGFYKKYFTSAAEETTKQVILTDIPDAEESELPEDKRHAYEEEDMEVDVSKGAQSLEELFPTMESNENNTQSAVSADNIPMMPDERSPSSRNGRQQFQSSQDDLLGNLTNFEQTKSEGNTEIEQVVDSANKENSSESEEEALVRKKQEAQDRALQALDQVMQRYAPQQATVQEQPLVDEERERDYVEVSPVVSGKNNVTSSLTGRGRRAGFYGSNEVGDQKNTIKASVYGKHVIQSGQYVRFRLSEPMQVGRSILPAGSILIGRAVIGEDRLIVTVNSIEYNDVIYSVDLDVYDTDGMLGLYLPGSMEMDAAREIGTDVANAMSTSATNSAMFQTQPSAAEQLKTDVGRGLIQGSFRYVGRKLQEIKVTVQDKHKVYLLPK